MALGRPLVLFLDEIDSLVGDTLVMVLRHLRSGYNRRPASFPQSVILCGVRDVKDYRLRLNGGKEVITGGSAFNIKAESLRLGDFSRQDLEALYLQGKRGPAWLKIKVARVGEFYAVALTPGEGSRQASFGALVLASIPVLLLVHFEDEEASANADDGFRPSDFVLAPWSLPGGVGFSAMMSF